MHLHSQCQFHLCHWLAFASHCRPLLPPRLHLPYYGGAMLPLFSPLMPPDNRKPSTNEGRMHVATYISIYKWYLPANRRTPETFATAAEISRVRRSRCITQKNQLKHDKQLKMQLLRPALLFWFAQVFLHTYTTAVGRRKKQTPAIVVNFTCWKLIVLFLLSWQLNANSADTTLVAQLLYIRTAGACCFRFHIFTFLHFCISQLKTTLDQLQFNRGSKSTWTLPLRVPK